jgi:hypothetical protein
MFAPVGVLDSLKPVTSAAWNATGAHDAQSLPIAMCTPGTRVSLLEDLMTWATASDSSCVFWLNGLAGTGKSTIARTLCERLDVKGLLGASFFVSRQHADGRDASTIVRSIAWQLAMRQRSFSDALCAKLRDAPISTTRSLQQQIADLIITPARELPSSSSLIIVIDALDECFTDSQDRLGEYLLELLVRQMLPLDGRVRLLFTSRPKRAIQVKFHQLPSASVVRLHDIDTATVREDIRRYLIHAFNDIRTYRLGGKLSTWPTTEDVEMLVELSGMLMIFAVTAIRFIESPRHDPRDRLAQCLDQRQAVSGTSRYNKLDAVYRQIMNDAVRDSPGGDEAWLCQRLRAGLAAMVLAKVPLDIETLAAISGLTGDETRIVVDSLTSVLADGTSGLRVFHPSFTDFAIDPARCMDPRLSVMPKLDHGLIALRCLAILNRDLRYNICSIQDPTVANQRVQGLDMALHENVSHSLRYAASFWCSHLADCDNPENSLLVALEVFCRDHLFHWVEILSLVQHVGLAESALLRAIEWCTVRGFVAQDEQGESDTSACRNTLRTPHPMSQTCYRTWREHCGSSRVLSVPTRCTHITAHL